MDERTAENKARAAISQGTSSIMDLWMQRWLKEFRSKTKDAPELADYVSSGIDMVLEEIKITAHRKAKEIEKVIRQAAVSAHAERAMQELFKASESQHDKV